MIDRQKSREQFYRLMMPACLAVGRIPDDLRHTSLPKFLFGVSLTVLSGLTVHMAVNRALGENSAQNALPVETIPVLKAQRDQYGALLFQACAGSFTDARTIDPNIPDVQTAFNGISMECEAILPDGKMVTWLPGRMPLDQNWKLIPGR